MSTLHTFDAPLRVAGFELGARMTVIDIGGDLLLYSPIDVDEAQVAALGNPRWVVAPNTMHHLFIGPWMERGLESWAPPALQEKRSRLRFDHLITEPCEPFGPDVQLIPLHSFPKMSEIVLHHRPSRTLVVADLVFNFPKDAEWKTRALMWACGAYPGCRASLIERFGMKREIAEREIAHLLTLDFDRIVLSHGAIVERDGREALRRAYHWLKLDTDAALLGA